MIKTQKKTKKISSRKSKISNPKIDKLSDKEIQSIYADDLINHIDYLLKDSNYFVKNYDDDSNIKLNQEKLKYIKDLVDRWIYWH